MDFGLNKIEIEQKKKITELFGSDDVKAVLETKEDLVKLQKILAESQKQWWSGSSCAKTDDADEAMCSADIALSAIDASKYLAVKSTLRLTGIISSYLSGDIKAEILADLQNGDLIGSVAISEPGDSDYKSDNSVDADGSLVLNLKKSFVANAPVADWLLISANIGDDLYLALVKSDSSNLKIGPAMDILGLKSLKVSNIECENLKISKDYIISKSNAISALAEISADASMASVFSGAGLMSTAVNAALKHAQKTNRDGKPLMAYQEINHKLAEMLTLTHSAELIARRAYWGLKTGDYEAALLVDCAKVFTSENAEQVCSMAMQVAAGQGLLSDSVFVRVLNDSKAIAMMGKTVEVSRMDIADTLLDRY